MMGGRGRQGERQKVASGLSVCNQVVAVVLGLLAAVGANSRARNFSNLTTLKSMLASLNHVCTPLCEAPYASVSMHDECSGRRGMGVGWKLPGAQASRFNVL